MALNAFKYIFASAREAGGGAVALTFPEHVRSLGSRLTELRPERRCRHHFSGACSFTLENNPLSFNVFRSMSVRFSLSSVYLCDPILGKQRKTDMAGKITSMSKIKQVL